MFAFDWSRWLKTLSTATRPVTRRKPTRRPTLGMESLEDRTVPTHFRYGTMAWEPVGTTGNTVEFHIQQSWRRDFGFSGATGAGGVANVGDILNVGSFIPNQTPTSGGTAVNLLLRVKSVSTADNNFVGEAVRQTGTNTYDEGIQFTYPTAGTYTAIFSGCCRISALQGGNNDTNYVSQTTVTVGGLRNSPPVSSMPPIIDIFDNQSNSFFIPAVDPNGDTLRYRLATSAESGMPFTSPNDHPTGADTSFFSINPTTGLVTWNVQNVGGEVVAPNQLYAVQVMVEDLDATTGAVKSKTPVDFIMRIADVTTNAPPTVTVNPAPPFSPVVGTTLTFTVTAADADGTITTFQATNIPDHMTVSSFVPGASSTLTVTFTPDQTQASQPFVVTFTATDNLNVSRSVGVQINPAANQRPVAVNDAYAVNEDTTLSVPATGTPFSGVLANDSDPEGNPFTAALVSTTANGTLTFNTNGSFTYAPAPNFFGTDTFTYRAADALGVGNLATVTITVNPVNDPPVATPDAAATNEDTPVVIAVTGNDSAGPNEAGQTLTPSVVTGPLHGAVTVNANGTITYTPVPDYFGPDSFTYRVSDGSAFSGPATVSITVNAVNDAPTANDDLITTAEDTPVTVNVLANDLVGPANEAGQTLTVTHLNGVPVAGGSVVATPHGTVRLNADGTVTYTPAANYNGPDTFTYTARDSGAPPLSADAAGRVTVNPVNDAPVARDDAYATDEDTPLGVPAPGLLANDTDVDLDPLTVRVLVDAPQHGALVLNADGSFTYTPFLNFNGTDSFTYKASDGTQDSNLATVTITVRSVNDKPVAVDDSRITDEDIPAVVPVLANDYDVDGSLVPGSVVVTVAPLHGSATVNPDGTITYTPAANYYGPDGFRYAVRDDRGAVSDEAGVSVTVNPVNDPPVAVGDAVVTPEDVAVTFDPRANDSDADHDALTAILDTPPSHGAVVVNPDGTFTYIPDTDFAGDDSFTYKVNDGATDSPPAAVTVRMTPVNDAPLLAVDHHHAAGPGHGPVYEGDVARNHGTYGDPDAGDAVTLSASLGTVVDNFDGTWSWSYLTTDGPLPGEVDVFITARDLAGATTTRFFHLEVENVAPTATIGDDGPVTYGQSFAVSLSNPFDPSSADTTAGLHYAFGLADDFTGVTYDTGSTTDPSQSYALGAGTYTVYARIIDKDGGFTQYSTEVTVDKAASVTAVSGGIFTYNGMTHGATGGSVTGDGGLNTIPSSITYTGTGGTTYGPTSAPPTDAGTYAVTAAYAGDADHDPSSATAAVTILKAASNTTVWLTGTPLTYTGAAQTPATVTVSGAGGLNTAPTSITYTGTGGTAYGPTSAPPTDAGTYAVTAAYAGDANHTASGDSKAFTICKAASVTTTVGAGPFTYDGTTHAGGSGTVAGAGVVTGAATVTYSGDRVNAGTYSVTAHYAGDANHLPSDGAPVAVLINRASATIVVTGYTVTYDGAAHAATGTATGVSGEDLSALLDLSGTAHTNAGSYAADPWAFAGNGNYAAASGTVHDAIARATAGITVNGYSVMYDGAAHGLSGTATGVGGANLSGFLTYGAGVTNVPGGSIAWSFDAGPNYNTAGGSATVTVTKANAVITVTPYAVTYDGTAHTATGTARGVLNEVLGGLDLSGTTHTNAGTTTDPWTFTDATGNYNNAAGTVGDAIAKAAAGITVTGYSGVYDGAAHGATGAATGVLGESLAGLTLGASFANYPGGTAAWAFTDVTGNYLCASGTAAIVIAKADAVVTVTGYTGVYDGAAHGATGSVGGVDAGGAALGASLGLGLSFTNAPGGTAYWTFNGGTNYLNETGSVPIAIAKANATISVSGYTGVYDGAAHGATGAATGVLGESLAGLTLGASFTNYPGGTATWAFTDVTGNYHNAAGSAAVVISKAPTTTTVVGGTFTYDGAAHGATGSSVTGAGGLSTAPTSISYSAAGYGPTATPPTLAGTYTVTATYAGDANHLGSTGTATVTIAPGSTGITVLPGGRLLIIGTSGDDDIKVNPGGGAPEIKVKMNGTQQTFVGITSIVIYARAGNDDVQVVGGITLPVIAFGEAGNDKMKAGGGPTVLAGGDGNDTLLGGNGRDILIGGAGADLIGGNGADDVLVAGSTLLDTELAGLGALQLEWTSARGFADRVANLSGTGSTGVNGTAVLTTAGPGRTLFDDNAVDNLTGDDGTDWFVFNSSGGVYVDAVTDMSAFEGLFDVDV